MTPSSHSNPVPAPEPLWVGVLGQDTLLIRGESVRAIDRMKRVYPLPLAERPLIGIQKGIDTYLPFIDVRNNPDPPPYTLILRTPKGLIGLATDAIMNWDQAHRDLDSETLANLSHFDVESILSHFPKRETIVESPVSESQSPTLRRALLLARVASTPLAIEPAHILSIEKHVATRTLHGAKDSPQRLVTLQDSQIIRGLSLRQALGYESADESLESWSVIMQDLATQERVAVLVDSMIGIETLSESDLFSITVNEDISTWFFHATLGNIEWLDIQPLISRHAPKTVRNYGTRQNTPDISALSLAQGIDYGWAEQDCVIVIPRELLESIGRQLESHDFEKESSPEHVALFDIRTLLGLANSPSEHRGHGRVVFLKTGSDSSIAVLLPDIMAVNPDTDVPWSPLPPLPRIIQDTFSGMRVVDDHAHYELNAEYLSKKLHQVLIDGTTSPAFSAWIRPEIALQQHLNEGPRSC